jgi:hypothetical protein
VEVHPVSRPLVVKREAARTIMPDLHNPSWHIDPAAWPINRLTILPQRAIISRIDRGLCDSTCFISINTKFP